MRRASPSALSPRGDVEDGAGGGDYDDNSKRKPIRPLTVILVFLSALVVFGFVVTLKPPPPPPTLPGVEVTLSAAEMSAKAFAMVLEMQNRQHMEQQRMVEEMMAADPFRAAAQDGDRGGKRRPGHVKAYREPPPWGHDAHGARKATPEEKAARDAAAKQVLASLASAKKAAAVTLHATGDAPAIKAAAAVAAAAARKSAPSGLTVALPPPLPPPRPVPPPPAGAPPAGRSSLVECATTKGPLAVFVYDGWSPNGTPRFLELVSSGFFSSQVALFRAIKGWIVQFGVSGDPALTKHWRKVGTIPDDPQWLPQEPNRFKRGLISFAGGGKDTRGTEMFIAYSDTALGAALHEVPFGQLAGDESYATLDAWYTGYGDVGGFGGHAPAQGKMYNRGLEYLKDPAEKFDQLDYITSCSITWQSDWTVDHKGSQEAAAVSSPELATAATKGPNVLGETQPLKKEPQPSPPAPPRAAPATPPLLAAALPSQHPGAAAAGGGGGSGGGPMFAAPVITVLVVPSPVEPHTRSARLAALSASWGDALRRVPGMRLRVLLSAPSDGSSGVGDARGKAVTEAMVDAEEAAVAEGRAEAARGAATGAGALPFGRGEEVLPRASAAADNAGRLLGALRAAHAEGTAWVFAANDHTFLVPENLRCFLDGYSQAAEAAAEAAAGGGQGGSEGGGDGGREGGGGGNDRVPYPLGASVWLGHRLKENGPSGAAFVSGAAGYVLSRHLLGRLLEATAEGGACKGSKRERSQPGLFLARCMREVLRVHPVELDDAAASGTPGAVENAHAPRVHVYGPARLVSGQVDKWWSEYRANSGAATPTGPACCSPATISFHYCFGPEQRLLNGLLRPGPTRDRFKAMTDVQRRDAWPSTKELGGYSYSLANDADAAEQLFVFLLGTWTVDSCPNAYF